MMSAKTTLDSVSVYEVCAEHISSNDNLGLSALNVLLYYKEHLHAHNIKMCPFLWPRKYELENTDTAPSETQTGERTDFRLNQ